MKMENELIQILQKENEVIESMIDGFLEIKCLLAEPLKLEKKINKLNKIIDDWKFLINKRNKLKKTKIENDFYSDLLKSQYTKLEILQKLLLENSELLVYHTYINSKLINIFAPPTNSYNSKGETQTIKKAVAINHHS
mgnify:CR=1 FL=1